MFFSYAADPKIVGDGAAAVAKKFSRVFGKPEQFYLQKMQDEKRFVWLERHVSPEVAKRLQANTLEGVAELNEPKRLYHYDNIGGQVIGCTNIDNVGISGIEYSSDKALRGADGFVVMQRDGMGRKRPSADYPRQEPVYGHSIGLTIDVGYQSIVEDELKKGVDRMKATAGLAMILNPNTGEVLAMAHIPSVNPYDVAHTDAQTLRARAVSDMFEPGSVFKIVTVSAALEHKLIAPGQMFFAEHGKYRVPLNGGKFRLITDTHESGMITFQQGLELSSNIVMAKASDIIGAERLYTQARDYGFGMPTGIELPGEASGELKKPVDWSGATLNSIAYGYEIAVTPLQIAAAYCAVANGGVLMKPYIIAKEMDEAGEAVYTGHPEKIRRVISEETAKTMKRFLRRRCRKRDGSVGENSRHHDCWKNWNVAQLRGRKVCIGKLQRNVCRIFSGGKAGACVFGDHGKPDGRRLHRRSCERSNFQSDRAANYQQQRIVFTGCICGKRERRIAAARLGAGRFTSPARSG